MKPLIGWLTAAAISASPCAWDTSQRELAERLQPTALLSSAAPPPIPPIRH
jgi:hypothetical protein